ncbi:hypothetical protein ACJJIF_03325 [Microbulbifer sp. SSSA002]|uniref:hypothetical protein n=1 Tax=unclassified Microbulbifer TaxID=2619833 RepID=UPI0040393C83
MKKKIILTCTILMLFGGIGLASSPFIYSMKPSAKAKAGRSQHDISRLEAGDFIFEGFDRASAWDESVLIIKDWDGSIYSYMVPIEQGKVIMPDRWWGWGYFHCANFGPEMRVDNKIKKSGYIKCHDTDVSEWQREEWVWSYSGKSQKSWVESMYSPGHEINGNYLYINR